MTEKEKKVHDFLIEIISKEAKEFVTKESEKEEIPVQIMEDEDIKDMAQGIARKITDKWELEI